MKKGAKQVKISPLTSFNKSYKRKFKYHKLTLLLVTFIFAYLLFAGRNFPVFNELILSLGYPGIFVSGMLFSYGFTAAPATALLLIFAKEYSLLWAGIIGGMGAAVSDILIFQFIRVTFKEEINQLSKEKIFQYVHRKTPPWLLHYLLPFLAGFIIASPLPDEIGVSLMASTTKIPLKIFILISFILNTAGIFIILGIGKII